ncbi:MAG: C26 family cysteine hydrolase domain-containing family [Bdellovibrionaceae bacterium]|nr:C26 family cysteine hydrolase domain-containing family [Pseudobdellovibrionaceae bacterium]
MVLQHVGHEPLGTLNPMLKAAGFRIRYVNFGRHPHSSPSLEGYRGLIVLGGPMGVYEANAHPHLKVELELIEDALKRNIPVLGICLGSQLLAHALGAQVRKGHLMEMGWMKVELSEEGSKEPALCRLRKQRTAFSIAPGYLRDSKECRPPGQVRPL